MENYFVTNFIANVAKNVLLGVSKYSIGTALHWPCVTSV